MNRFAMRRWARHTAAAALLLTFSAQQSWAWGREGHRLTALVAESYLTPETRAAIKELLGRETLADVAPWADDYRQQHPETGPWHFVDIPRNQEKFDRSRDCPENPTDKHWRDCISDRILYFEGRLGDESLPREQRAEALKFLVHFMGDIHQPMHAIGDDRGGNGISVGFLGSNQCGSYKCNLHGVWDESILEHRGLSEARYHALLLEEIKSNNWERLSGGEPTTWANVSHHYAVNAYAPNGALLDSKYVAEQTKVVDAELALGGLRLARVLNRLLGSPSTPEPGRTPLPAPAATSVKAQP